MQNLKACRVFRLLLLQHLLYTGVRNAELANMFLEDVNLNMLTIRIEQGKGKKDRYFPFAAFFHGEFAQYVDNQKSRRANIFIRDQPP